MRKLLLYIIIVLILFSGYKQIKEIWETNDINPEETVTEVKEGFWSWFEKAADSTKGLKEALNERIKSATEKYDSIKSEVEDITGKVTEKKNQLDQTLKEIEEAKKALDELLEREPESVEETTGETSTGTTEVGDDETGK